MRIFDKGIALISVEKETVHENLVVWFLEDIIMNIFFNLTLGVKNLFPVVLTKNGLLKLGYPLSPPRHQLRVPLLEFSLQFQILRSARHRQHLLLHLQVNKGLVYKFFIIEDTVL